MRDNNRVRVDVMRNKEVWHQTVVTAGDEDFDVRERVALLAASHVQDRGRRAVRHAGEQRRPYERARDVLLGDGHRVRIGGLSIRVDVDLAEVEAEQGCGSGGCELADCKEKDEGEHVHGRRREGVLRDWVLCKDRDCRKRCL